jgi:phosphocarrier protein
VTVTRDDQSVGGTSIMGRMMLAAGPGNDLALSATGPDAAAAIAALAQLVRDGFGEECVAGEG